MAKLTPWFLLRTSPPARVGVYNVSCQEEMQSGRFYSYWDGDRFHWYGFDVDDAYTNRDYEGSGLDTKSWRGLARKPK